jgi:hypothetical protein
MIFVEPLLQIKIITWGLQLDLLLHIFDYGAYLCCFTVGMQTAFSQNEALGYLERRALHRDLTISYHIKMFHRTSAKI